MMSKEAMRLALNKAFQLGQRYWSWADSEYSSHWKKADAAKAEFDQLVQNTINAALAEQPAQQDMPKIGCVNHDCDKCKAQQEPVRVPVTDNTYNYAKSLAEAIFKQHFASDEHYSSGRIVWGVNDTVIGILTQIDNMVADMARKPAQQQEPYGQVTVFRRPGCVDQHWFYRWPKPPYLDNAVECHTVYTFPPAQQEPVAWVVEDNDGERLEWAGDIHSVGGLPTFPLYTSQPARKPWVGLTDEEIEIIFNNWPTYHLDHEEFARAIEAKLKEKNA